MIIKKSLLCNISLICLIVGASLNGEITNSSNVTLAKTKVDCISNNQDIEFTNDNTMSNHLQNIEIDIETNENALVIKEETNDNPPITSNPIVEEVSNTNSKEENNVNFVKVDYIQYASTCLNIRSLPCIEGDKIGTFSYGEEVHVVEETKDSTWVKVACNDTEGYCNSKYLVDNKPEIISKSGDGSIIIIGDISTEIINSVYAYYDKISSHTKDRFQLEGWSIYLTTEDLSKRFENISSVLATTNYGDKAIYVSNKDTTGDSIVHEFGHFVDDVSGKASLTEEFGNIYASELDSFTSWHNTHSNNYSTCIEYFAECYQECILHPLDMQQYCPNTYNYIMSIVNSL